MLDPWSRSRFMSIATMICMTPATRAHSPIASTVATSVMPGRASNQNDSNTSPMPNASMNPQYGITSRPATAPEIVRMPLNSTYQPIQNAMTSSVGDGHAHTSKPRPNSSKPKASDQPLLEPSTGTLNMSNTPRNTNSAPMKTARSPSFQSVNKMMPPATTVMMPLTRSTHQPRSAVEVVGRVERICNEHRSLLWFGTS